MSVEYVEHVLDDVKNLKIAPNWKSLKLYKTRNLKE